MNKTSSEEDENSVLKMKVKWNFDSLYSLCDSSYLTTHIFTGPFSINKSTYFLAKR